ncbi:MAG: hypothetical protein JRJ04_19050, partial [Deltaproteobacteria bacterium]|nr:hypothetical protein [Deltaproteobacteria bacterium]
MKKGYLLVLQALKTIWAGGRQTLYLEALPPEQVRCRLEAIGLKQDWVFADFDEVIIHESSQQLWAKRIVKNKKETFPSIFWKYIHHYKWKENLYELNKIFKYSDGMKELEDFIIPHLKFNENAKKILNALRNKDKDSPGFFRKLIHKFFSPWLNLVIVSSNTGAIIKRFLEK